jgi:hypothetical protein
MRLLLQPEHRGKEERHFAATRAALRYYGEWFGPYPYGHITIVDRQKLEETVCECYQVVKDEFDRLLR